MEPAFAEPLLDGVPCEADAADVADVPESVRAEAPRVVSDVAASRLAQAAASRTLAAITERVARTGEQDDGNRMIFRVVVD
jgi:hypothetical protein